MLSPSRVITPILFVMFMVACGTPKVDSVASDVAQAFATHAAEPNVAGAVNANISSPTAANGTSVTNANSVTDGTSVTNANSVVNANNLAVSANAPTARAPVPLSPSWGGAYPRLTRLADNSLLGTITGFAQGVNHLRVTRSTDNGVSFTDYGEITQGVGDIDNAQTIQLSYVAPGATVPRILAAFRNHTRDANGNYTVFRITVCRSDDGGKTWTFHSQVATSQPPNGLWEPFMFNAPDGSLQVYYARENAADDQDIVMQRSSDGGATWSAFQVVAGAGIVSRDGMPGIATYFDGTSTALMAIFESESNGIFHVMSVKSTDSGSTWAQRSTVFAPPSGHNAGSPQIASVGSQLVAVFMTDEDAASIAWPANAAIKLVTSTAIATGSVSWSPDYTVAPASSYWPGILTNDRQSMFVTYNSVAQLLPLSSVVQ